MPKNIIFCADGTWNGPGEPDSDDPTAPATNVFKLFANLDGRDSPGSIVLAKEQERDLRDSSDNILQTAKYIDGVGDSSNFLIRLLGGSIGVGLVIRVVRGYTFISRNYCRGDNIFVVGFSRGAYTVRALAGLIASKGLLDATKLRLADKEHAYRLGLAVWYAHLKAARQDNPDLLGRLEEFVLDLPGFLSGPASPELVRADLEAVAVWDTVGALGIPEFTVNMNRVDALQFADRKLSPCVRHGIQAIAIDEQRADFTPTLWDPDDRIMQVLFPGAHADVGGGYPVTDHESGISDCTLSWMTGHLGTLGVRFATMPTYSLAPDPKGTAHEPWTGIPWKILVRRPRSFPPGLCITRCLLDRCGGGPVLAAPGATPALYAPHNLGGYLIGNKPIPGICVAP